MDTENKSSTQITDVIFDMCGVLIDWQSRLALEGQYPDGVIDMFLDPQDPWGFDYYDTMENVGWSKERILSEYEIHHGPAVAWVYRVYFERRRLALKSLVLGMGKLLVDLKAHGIRLWGLTNFMTVNMNMALEAFPELNLLEDIVISSEEKIRKPDPEIYRRAINRFAVVPEHTLFVDDDFRNVAAARNVGLQAVRFQSAEALREYLSHHLKPCL